jgi:glutamyl-tRNA synthetase
MNVWFEKIKDIADMLGFASDMKAYKQNPEAYKGNVSDISMFIRLAVTGKLNSPDMYSVMQIMGYDKVINRVNEMIKVL